MRRTTLAALAAALAANFLAPSVNAASFVSEYSLTAFGLRIASTQFQSTINGSGYTVNGTLRTRGIARLFSTTDGTLTATGAVNGSTVSARSFDVRYTDNGRSKRTRIAFSGGRVSSASNDPNVTRKDDWIDVPAAQLANVLDPVAAMMVPAPSLGQVCGRTLRTFSGALRVDLKLDYMRTIPFSTKGYSGDAVTCRAHFLPIAGYNKSKRELTDMRDNGRIEVTFAPIGQTGLYAPVKARIRVDGTTVNVTATRFEQLTN